MFGLFSSKEHAIQLNDTQKLVAKSQETILQAALRDGVNFPYSCKVGGCATCKCQLVKGKVRELTDSAYILSGEEIQAGYILACQSIPKTDVEVSVDFSRAAVRQIPGKVVKREKLTDQISQVSVMLEEPMLYTAGQYAHLTINDKSSVSRPYSFASAPDKTSNEVHFFVKSEEGGYMSNRLNNDDIVGAEVSLEGPVGEFTLSESDAPALFIATGSGLAPILAILQAAAASSANKRPAVLLFGARTQADLYALESIKKISAAWAGSFDWVPVLSREPEGSDWQGKRGRVSDIFESFVTSDSEAYLCGSPSMIDDSIVLLKRLGLGEGNIFADRFLSAHELTQ